MPSALSTVDMSVDSMTLTTQYALQSVGNGCMCTSEVLPLIWGSL